MGYWLVKRAGYIAGFIVLVLFLSMSLPNYMEFISIIASSSSYLLFSQLESTLILFWFFGLIIFVEIIYKQTKLNLEKKYTKKASIEGVEVHK